MIAQDTPARVRAHEEGRGTNLGRARLDCSHEGIPPNGRTSGTVATERSGREFTEYSALATRDDARNDAKRRCQIGTALTWCECVGCRKRVIARIGQTKVREAARRMPAIRSFLCASLKRLLSQTGHARKRACVLKKAARSWLGRQTGTGKEAQKQAKCSRIGPNGLRNHPPWNVFQQPATLQNGYSRIHEGKESCILKKISMPLLVHLAYSLIRGWIPSHARNAMRSEAMTARRLSDPKSQNLGDGVVECLLVDIECVTNRRINTRYAPPAPQWQSPRS